MVLINTSHGIYHAMSDSLYTKYGTLTRKISASGNDFKFYPCNNTTLVMAVGYTLKDCLIKAGFSRDCIKAIKVYAARYGIALENWEE